MTENHQAHSAQPDPAGHPAPPGETMPAEDEIVVLAPGATAPLPPNGTEPSPASEGDTRAPETPGSAESPHRQGLVSGTPAQQRSDAVTALDPSATTPLPPPPPASEAAGAGATRAPAPWSWSPSADPGATSRPQPSPFATQQLNPNAGLVAQQAPAPAAPAPSAPQEPPSGGAAGAVAAQAAPPPAAGPDASAPTAPAQSVPAPAPPPAAVQAPSLSKAPSQAPSAPPAGAAAGAVAAASGAVALAERPQEGADPVTGNRQNQPGTNQSVYTFNLDPVIEMVDVAKAFGSFRVLDGVTFRIPRGGVTFLMGPSGTGKSVCLRHIVGLLMPDRGDVIVDGKNVPKLNEKEVLVLRRQVGMLFQDGALFSSMNLYDNVAFPLRQHTKFGEGKIREIVMSRLSEVGLAGAEKRMPNELSGGMRKRAGFARALVMEPKIILVDEPDSGLDPVRTTLLCDLIKEIAKKYDATVIVISHNIEAVRRTADFIGILYKGKMRHFGTKQEIEDSPDEFVKQFFNAEPEGPLGMD